MTEPLPNNEGGPSIRQQIVDAADEHFSRFGYAKTTMSDLARAIGFSKAYIYKFFDSKQSIGEAICTRCLFGQLGAVLLAIEGASGANERLRALFRTVVEQNKAQFFADRQLYDIVAHSRAENWSSSTSHIAQLNDLLRNIILTGRADGEFERKTPLDEVCRGIWLALLPFTDPVLLQHNLDFVEDGFPALIGVVLRSLAP